MIYFSTKLLILSPHSGTGSWSLVIGEPIFSSRDHPAGKKVALAALDGLLLGLDQQFTKGDTITHKI
jgi:hypothetical protein